MGIEGGTAQEIADSVRGLLQEGALTVGATLPPVRQLAAELGVNRNTVAAAYRTLVLAGVAETRGRGGTVLRDNRDAGEQEGSAEGTPLTDLASGNPDPALLPDLTTALVGLDVTAKLYGGATIDPGLADAAERTFADLTAEITRAGWVLSVTGGAVDAHERILAAYLSPGDQVAVEDPCFLSSINALNHAGLRSVPVPVDAEGMRPDRLRAALSGGARAVIVTSRAHNPTGVSLTAARAQELQQVVSQFPQVLVIEDDHYSLLAAEPYRRVASAGTQHWALVRSVSKFFGPDLRVGLLASDEATAALVSARFGPGTNWVSHLLQRLTAALLNSTTAETAIVAAADTYRRRAGMLVTALAAEDIAVRGPQEGLNVWIDLDVDAQQVGAALMRRGWLVRAGRSFSAATDPARNAIRVTIATMTESIATTFASALAAALDDVDRSARRRRPPTRTALLD
ncbi:aminotransferase class I/II-fold pyridoxal phosphate-dependent enzyme [Rhodococcus sp. ABRD24]|uniref:aminotransferase class I/II-fold pyridoxal phosphate-dependent enzyme n=1 Tax=Rhodococcus sp. ABRD24 TaxID=2507582 RepID=UPI0010395973|nr:aminotransferase class I/II-fold pyridoxal phosphate-dependent enzyme [Rhodococcus sp. ABRD24]QBJ97220.1 aminotransferase class I/II-fold pyridoxal phosphate-dependent enzyme [Rhodococcus sp. ABRD24]